MFTEGGNQLVVGEDKQGRVYFIDQNGNFYYDTGDKTLGFYMVCFIFSLTNFPLNPTFPYAKYLRTLTLLLYFQVALMLSFLYQSCNLDDLFMVYHVSKICKQEPYAEVKFGLQVSRDDKVYNLFTDRDGKRTSTYVGNFEDLQTFNIASLGGIPVEQLEKFSKYKLGNEFTAFVAPADKGKAPTNEDFTKVIPFQDSLKGFPLSLFQEFL